MQFGLRQIKVLISCYCHQHCASLQCVALMHQSITAKVSQSYKKWVKVNSRVMNKKKKGVVFICQDWQIHERVSTLFFMWLQLWLISICCFLALIFIPFFHSLTVFLAFPVDS